MEQNQQHFDEFLADYLVGRQSLYTNMVEQLGGVDKFVENYRDLLIMTDLNDELLGFENETDRIDFYVNNQHEIKKKIEELGCYLGFSSLADYIHKNVAKDDISLEEVQKAILPSTLCVGEKNIKVVSWLLYEAFEGLASYFDYFEMDS